MLKKEVKVKEFGDRRYGFKSLNRFVEKWIQVMMIVDQIEWMDKQHIDFWKEVTEKYDLNPEYEHEYIHKTKTIRETYKKVFTKDR